MLSFQGGIVNFLFNKRIEKLSLFNSLNISSFHLWFLKLGDLELFEKKVSYSLLNEDEKNHAQKLILEEHKEHFIMRRALSKIILSTYTYQPPALIRFSYNTYKKPYLQNYSKISFNISHCSNCALLAVNKEPLGIDIEEIKERNDFINLLDPIASFEEKRWVGLSLERFFILWTIKEALLKAEGTGFLRESIPVLQILPFQKGSLFLSSSENYKAYTVFSDNKVISLAFKNRESNIKN